MIEITNPNQQCKHLRYYSIAIEKDSTNGSYFYERGYSEAQIFDYENAINDYNQSIKLKHRMDDAYFNIGCCFKAISKDSLAYLNYKKAILINPSHNQAKKEIENIEGIIHL